ncbi:MAG: hypothetical protein ABL966_14305 [Acidimicrobiales bacterium]
MTRQAQTTLPQDWTWDDQDDEAVARVRADRMKARRRRRRHEARVEVMATARRVLWASFVGIVAGLVMYVLAMSGVAKLLEDRRTPEVPVDATATSIPAPTPTPTP